MMQSLHRNLLLPLAVVAAVVLSTCHPLVHREASAQAQSQAQVPQDFVQAQLSVGKIYCRVTGQDGKHTWDQGTFSVVSNGFILTNNHVVEGCLTKLQKPLRKGDILLYYPDGTVDDEPTLVQRSRKFDLALLTTSHRVPALSIDVGHKGRVCVHGYARGDFRTVCGEFQGYAISRDHPWRSAFYKGHCPPGMSGGPGFNSEGKLVAVVWGSTPEEFFCTTSEDIFEFIHGCQMALTFKLDSGGDYEKLVEMLRAIINDN